MKKVEIECKIRPATRDMFLQIKSVPTSGGLEIFLDGHKWADGFLNHRGQYGYYFDFVDIHHQPIYPAGTKHKGQHNHWLVWSDKHMQRSAKPGEEIKPLPERLVEAITLMVRTGQLTSPETLRRVQAEEQQKRLARQLVFETEEQKAFDARAEEVLVGMNYEGDHETIKARIVAAMRWAQSQ